MQCKCGILTTGPPGNALSVGCSKRADNKVKGLLHCVGQVQPFSPCRSLGLRHRFPAGARGLWMWVACFQRGLLRELCSFSHGRYKDGQDHIGEHRDDERELAPGSPIASVSFGACRDFFFRHKDSRGKHPSRRLAVVRLQLAHGSLLMMNHPTNTHWYHSLPVRKKVLAPRVNLTFRKILPTTK